MLFEETSSCGFDQNYNSQFTIRSFSFVAFLGSAKQHHTIPHHATPRHATPHHTTPHHTTLDIIQSST
jgi:hypothetical protein